MGKDARHPAVAELVAPDLVSGGALELEQVAVVADEEERVAGRERLAEDRAPGAEGPQHPAILDANGVHHTAGGANVRDAFGDRGRGEDLAAEHGAPERPGTTRDRGELRLGGQLVDPLERSGAARPRIGPHQPARDQLEIEVQLVVRDPGTVATDRARSL